MESEIKDKLRLLSDIWENYIFEYKYFSSKLKFDKKPYYVTGLLGYFQDMVDIIFPKKNNEHKNSNIVEHTRITSNNYSEEIDFFTNDNNYHSRIFAHHISFLQAIFVQQDLMQELLSVFKTNIGSKELWLDETYSENRKIRNELVGHPINRKNGKLISNTLFGYQSGYSEMQYLIYYKDNSDKSGIRTHKVEDIKLKHELFLVKYLDIIINKSKDLLCEYLPELEKIEKEIAMEILKRF